MYIWILLYMYIDIHNPSQSKNHPESWRKKQKKSYQKHKSPLFPKILVFQSSQPPFPDRVFWMTLERS